MNNFKSCVPCVCTTGSGRKQSCEEQNKGMTTIEDWIKQHHNIMKESHDIGLQRIEDKAKKRSVRHGGQDHPLQPGDRVWLRKRVLGRNKIQDF